MYNFSIDPRLKYLSLVCLFFSLLFNILFFYFVNLFIFYLVVFFFTQKQKKPIKFTKKNKIRKIALQTANNNINN